ncbi:MAG TPA: hypothetical protein VGN60_09145 [Devosia sp.]|jgi:hypothetical protein|nr:hypothetical protein [Devosia sp.]
MAKAKSTPAPDRRIMPAKGGSSIRDKATGELRPNIPAEPAAEPAKEGN